MAKSSRIAFLCILYVLMGLGRHLYADDEIARIPRVNGGHLKGSVALYGEPYLALTTNEITDQLPPEKKEIFQTIKTNFKLYSSYTLLHDPDSDFTLSVKTGGVENFLFNHQIGIQKITLNCGPHKIEVNNQSQIKVNNKNIGSFVGSKTFAPIYLKSRFVYLAPSVTEGSSLLVMNDDYVIRISYKKSHSFLEPFLEISMDERYEYAARNASGDTINHVSQKFPYSVSLPDLLSLEDNNPILMEMKGIRNDFLSSVY